MSTSTRHVDKGFGFQEVVVRRVVAWRWKVGGGDEGDATVGIVTGGDGDGGDGGLVDVVKMKVGRGGVA
ncbi:hypothetical protein Tco_1564884, partial [Tanacetum coccineum]